MAAGERTEKATPRKRDEARKKGQVARSADLSGAVVLLASLLAITAFGPHVAAQARLAMTSSLDRITTPEVVSLEGIGALLTSTAQAALLAVAPIALVCLAAGVAVNLAQVGWKPSAEVLKPDPKRLNPLSGAKNLFGQQALVETGKTLLKFGTIGAICVLAVSSQLGAFTALVGAQPELIVSKLMSTVVAITERAGIVYLAIAAIDVVWQRYRHEKQLRMDKQEVKDEMKQHALPPEVRGALRRRQTTAARARMMAAVPEADVVVTNPTHFAVALRYDGEQAAPTVIAKGQDLVARRIREIAAEHDVPIVPDPPLARSLHASVEVGQLIPEELYQAVAQVLAFVYKAAGRRIA